MEVIRLRLALRETEHEFRLPLRAPAFGSCDGSASVASLLGVMGFRALSFIHGLIGCRHLSRDGVQRKGVRFSCALPLQLQ